MKKLWSHRFLCSQRAGVSVIMIHKQMYAPGAEGRKRVCSREEDWRQQWKVKGFMCFLSNDKGENLQSCFSKSIVDIASECLLSSRQELGLRNCWLSNQFLSDCAVQTTHMLPHSKHLHPVAQDVMLTFISMKVSLWWKLSLSSQQTRCSEMLFLFEAQYKPILKGPGPANK